MFKKVVFIAILLVFVLSQNPHGHLSSQGKAGGFTVLDQESLLQVQQNQMFQTASKKMRDYYYQQTQKELGEILKIETQVVAGVNYRVTFQSTDGPVTITIFCQPWTNTYQITGMTKSQIQSN